MPDELRVGDILPNPHLSGKSGKVTSIVITWYGCAITYDYDGCSCVSGVFTESVSSPPAVFPIFAGIEVDRDQW